MMRVLHHILAVLFFLYLDISGKESRLNYITYSPLPSRVYVGTIPVNLTIKVYNATGPELNCDGRWVVDRLPKEPSRSRFLITLDTLKNNTVLRCYLISFYTASVVNKDGVLEQKEMSDNRNRILVNRAYIGTRFQMSPVDIRVAMNAEHRIVCKPPKSLPEAIITWEKNGVPINFNDTREYIKSSENYLIIAKARHNASYTCVARNPAFKESQRATAFMEVYVDGGWSSWSRWSTCSRCGQAYSRRTRQCQSPRPTVNGAQCSGDRVMKRRCPPMAKCRVHDQQLPKEFAWSQWTLECVPKCSKRRNKKTCLDNSADSCIDSIQRQPCTEDLAQQCKRGLNMLTGNPSQDDRVTAPNSMIYGVLFAILVCFCTLICVLVAFIIYRKRKLSGIHHKKTTLGAEGVNMLAVPDVAITSLQARPLPGTPASHTGSSGTDSTSSSVLAHEKNPLYCNALPASQLDSRPQYQGDYQRLPDADNKVYATFSLDGGRLSLPNSGVALFLSALTNTQRIYLKTSQDCRPTLSDNETVLSPICTVETSDRQETDVPFVLSLPHCAGPLFEQWTFSVHCRHDDRSRWQMVSELGAETLNTPIYAHMQRSQVHIMAESFMSYILIGKPLSDVCTKRLKVAVYAGSVLKGHESDEIDIRVYFIDSTNDALMSVEKLESRLDGVLLDCARDYDFTFNAGNLCVSVADFSEGWMCKGDNNYLEVPWRHLWCNTQSSLHCSFSIANKMNRPPQLSCQVQVYQEALPATSLYLHYPMNSDTMRTITEPKNVTLISNHSSQSNNTSSSVGTSGFSLGAELKNKLCQALNPPNCNGNDWRRLAACLHIDRYINYFATKTNPTGSILELWLASRADQDSRSSVNQLLDALSQMDRRDAIAVVERYNGWV